MAQYVPPLQLSLPQLTCAPFSSDFSKVDPHPDPVALANPSLYDGHLARFNRGALVPKGNLSKAGSVPPPRPVEARIYSHARTSLGPANYG